MYICMIEGSKTIIQLYGMYYYQRQIDTCTCINLEKPSSVMWVAAGNHIVSMAIRMNIIYDGWYTVVSPQ